MEKIFKNLNGTWAIQRILGNFGNATGKAVFSEQNANSLFYHEDLEINFHSDNLIITGKQDYIYTYDRNNKIITKNFRDNRSFYQLKFKDNNHAYGEHICSLDIYKAEYIFINVNQFKLDYIIKGPNKNYTIESVFTKNSTDIVF